jgi:hypothetical protein
LGAERVPAAWADGFLQIPEDAEKVDAGGLGIEFAVTFDPARQLLIRSQVADVTSLNFEQFLIDMSADRKLENDNLSIVVFTSRSFNDVSFQTIFLDLWKLFIGYVIMFAFTVLMLGKVSKTEVPRSRPMSLHLHLAGPSLPLGCRNVFLCPWTGSCLWY